LQFLALGEAEHARLVPDPQVTVAVLQLVDHLAGGYPGDENGVQFAVLVATADLVEEQDRLLRPLLAGDQPPAPTELRQALSTIDHHVRDYIDHARLPTAA